jgi:large subunit GTPase 1
MRKERGKTPKEGLGRALVRKNKLSHATKRRDGRLTNQHYHISDDVDEVKQNQLDSIMERNALDEFLTNAIMEEADFAAQKTNVVMVAGSTVVNVKTKNTQEQLEYEDVRIPRRPEWTHEMASDELQRLEREKFLDWRRTLAQYEEASADKHSTPFEKNLEVWKQLWRVAERSHVVCQIVDARNPLLYYCADVFTFAKELDVRKRCILIINKSDFLTREAREQWGRYFDSINVEYVFFSAKQENLDQSEYLDALDRQTQMRLNRLLQDQNGNGDDGDDGDGDDNDDESITAKKATNPFALFGDDDNDDDDDDDVETSEKTQKTTSHNDSPIEEETNDEDDNDEDDDIDTPLEPYESKIIAKDKYDVYGRTQLIELLRSIADPEYLKDTTSQAQTQRQQRGLIGLEHSDPHFGKVNIGLLGYPNVGKSSTINALIGIKKVSVAATPGHTKHFQTLSLEDDLIICDCPGLVFPTFVHSKHTLVVHGVIPIDTLREYLGPIEVLCQKIPKSQIMQEYGIEIPSWKTMDATTLLQSYCKVRSFYKQAGTLDEARAAKIFLKDYVNGKLLYCQSPPNTTLESRKSFYESYRLGISGATMNETKQSLEQKNKLATSMDFITETEQMTNSQQSLLSKHASIDDTQQIAFNDVIDVTISRERIVTVRPDVDNLTIADTGKSHRQNMKELEETEMSKKHMRKLQKLALRGKSSTSNNGAISTHTAGSKKFNKGGATIL